MKHLKKGLFQAARYKQRPPGEQMVKNCSQRIDIAVGAAGTGLPRLLRWHVARRAEDLSGGRQFGIFFKLLRQTKIGDARLVEAVDEHIRRFEVSMEHSALMR